MKINLSPLLWLALAVTTFALLLLAWPSSSVQAGPTLPDRATPTPTPVPARNHRDTAIGAYIELSVTGAPAGAWAAVQWQDSAGGWRDVEGWQGALDAGGTRWWVAAKDFGTGPFQWLVSQGRGGAVLGVSRPFTLPTAANQTVQVRVTLAGP